jgi:hypothetical protein
MCAVLVVVADIIGEQALHVALVHCDDVIEQIVPTTFNPTFGHSVLPRAFEGGSDRAHLQGSNNCGNLKSELPIPVKNQKLRSRTERKRLTQLLDGVWSKNSNGLKKRNLQFSTDSVRMDFSA